MLLEKIETISTDLSNFKENISNMRLPYAYFKKFNILPINFIEGELDKHFEYGVLMFENTNSFDYETLYEFTWEETMNKLFQYHKLPLGLYNEMNHRADMYMFRNMLLKNLNFYKSINVICEGQYNNWIHHIEEDKIKHVKKGEKKITDYWLKYNEINEDYLDRVPMLGCLIDKWNGNVLYHNSSGDYTGRNGWKIIKVCNKIIKYFSKYEGVNKQIKIEEFKRLITNNNACKYQLCRETSEGEHIGVFQYKEITREDGSSTYDIWLNCERANKHKRVYE